MKNIIRFIPVLLLCFILLVLPGEGIAATDSDFVYYERSSDHTAVVTGYLGTETDIVIPAEINGLTVTDIGFSYYLPQEGDFAAATTLTLPDTVTHIGSMAFRECTNLTAISIPASVAVIDPYTFGRLPSLREINVAPDNPVYVSVDGVLFEKDTNTLIRYPIAKPDERYVIPQGTEQIEGNAFAECASLRSVTIPDSVTVIKYSAFIYCTGLEEVVIPGSVTSMGWSAFSGSGLKSVEIQDGVTSVGISAFQNCQNLTAVTLPDSVTEIDYGAFSYCPNLTDVRLPEGLTELGPVFRNCTGLTRITIPDSVKLLSGTFAGCSALTEVILPDGLSEIAESTFENCTSLETLRLPSALRYIGRFAFQNCAALKVMDFTQSPALLVIDQSAFSRCSALEEVILSDGMPSLGEQAFENCESLKTVNWIHVPIPETLVAEGEINYLSFTDRAVMIQFLARHAARQQGYTVLPDMDADGTATETETWREEKIAGLEQILTETRETVSALQAEIDDPETPENKKKALTNRIASSERTIAETEEAISGIRELQLLLDSEAQEMWESDTGLANIPESDMGIYQLWQETFVAMQNGKNLPEGYTTVTSYLTAEDGLRYMTADAHALEHITNNFFTNDSGSIYYLPGSGSAGIGALAFCNCRSLEQITIPSSITQIAENAFRGCPDDMAVITGP